MEYLSAFIGNDSNISRTPDFDHQQDVAMFSTLQQQEYAAQEYQNTQSYWQPPQSTFTTPTPPPNYSSSQQPSEFAEAGPFTPFVPQPEFGTTQPQSGFPETNFYDLGMMFTSDSDEQWTSFVQDTRLLSGNMDGLGQYDVGEITTSI